MTSNQYDSGWPDVEVHDKPWGSAECLLAVPMFQLHRVRFGRGGVGDLHYHKAQNCVYYVVEGRLDVLWVFPLNVDRRDMLQAGQHVMVPPDVLHRFEAVTDGEVLVLCFPAEVSAADVVRIMPGFLTQ